jgi:hypothetical protein
MKNLIESIESHTKQDAQHQVELIIARVKGGHMYPQEAWAKAKFIKEVCTKVENETKEQAKDYFESLHANDRFIYGNEVTFRRGYDTLDYEQDPEYAQLMAKVKARKKMLDTIHKNKLAGIVNIDQESGEELTGVPVKSSVKDSIQLKLK